MPLFAYLARRADVGYYLPPLRGWSLVVCIWLFPKGRLYGAARSRALSGLSFLGGLPRTYVPSASSGQALGYYLPPLRGCLPSGFGRSRGQASR